MHENAIWVMNFEITLYSKNTKLMESSIFKTITPWPISRHKMKVKLMQMLPQRCMGKIHIRIIYIYNKRICNSIEKSQNITFIILLVLDEH